jgi:hypothetical protein
MKPEEIIALFGFSEFSPEILLLFKGLGIYGNRPENSVCWRTFVSQTFDLTLVFKGKNNYKSDYGPINKAYTDSHDESVLEEINFGNHKGATNYPFPLPYNWTFSDTADTVKKKIGLKASELSESSYGSYLVFNTEDVQFLTGFDKEGNLIWVRVMPLEISFKRKRELSSSLRKQNKNIHTSNLHLFTELVNNSPTIEWIKRLQEGDKGFSKNAIDDSEKLLNQYIENLKMAAKKENARAVYSASKKVVIGFNKLNDKHNGFIDTMEREELVDFLHQAIQITGFILDDGMDITEEWREW